MQQSNIQVKPQYAHWQLIEKSGLIVKEGYQHNMILNQAKEQMPLYGMDGITEFCVVGSGSALPAVGQTGMVAELVRTNVIPAGEQDTLTQQSPGVYRYKRVRQFTPGQVGGQNLQEWGFSPLGNAGNNLAVREVFRDGLNNPIPLTPSATQSLRIIYVTEVTLTPVVAQPLTLNIAGLGNRAANWMLYNGNDYHTVNALITGSAAVALINAPIDLNYFSTGFWFSALLAGKVLPVLPYVPNSKNRTYGSVTWNENQGNTTIHGIMVRDSVGRNGLALSFDAGNEIVKDNLHSLTIGGFGVNWS